MRNPLCLLILLLISTAALAQVNPYITPGTCGEDVNSLDQADIHDYINSANNIFTGGDLTIHMSAAAYPNRTYQFFFLDDSDEPTCYADSVVGDFTEACDGEVTATWEWPEVLNSRCETSFSFNHSALEYTDMYFTMLSNVTDVVYVPILDEYETRIYTFTLDFTLRFDTYTSVSTQALTISTSLLSPARYIVADLDAPANGFVDAYSLLTGLIDISGQLSDGDEVDTTLDLLQSEGTVQVHIGMSPVDAMYDSFAYGIKLDSDDGNPLLDGGHWQNEYGCTIPAQDTDSSYGVDSTIVDVADFEHCALLCCSDYTCLAFNYHTDTQDCELATDTSDLGTATNVASGLITHSCPLPLVGRVSGQTYTGVADDSSDSVTSFEDCRSYCCQTSTCQAFSFDGTTTCSIWNSVPALDDCDGCTSAQINRGPVVKPPSILKQITQESKKRQNQAAVDDAVVGLCEYINNNAPVLGIQSCNLTFLTDCSGLITKTTVQYPSPFTVEFRTVIPSDYQLTYATNEIINIDAGIYTVLDPTTPIAEVGTAGGSVTGGFRTQNWVATMRPDQGSCQLNNQVVVSFALSWVGALESPLNDNHTNWLMLSFIVTSGNFCPKQVDDDGSFTGDITAFTDAGRTADTTSFDQKEQVWFQLELTHDRFDIDTTTLVNLTFANSLNAEVVQIVVNEAVVLNTINFTPESTIGTLLWNGGEALWNLRLNPVVFSVSPGIPKTFTFTAVVRVEFEQQGSKRRQAGVDNEVTFDFQMVVQYAEDITANSSSGMRLIPSLSLF